MTFSLFLLTNFIKLEAQLNGSLKSADAISLNANREGTFQTLHFISATQKAERHRG